MTANDGDKDPPYPLKGQLSKKLLVKDRILSKISFTKSGGEDKILKVQQSKIMVKSSEDEEPKNVEYQVYPQRWWILSTVVILNLGMFINHVDTILGFSFKF